AYALRRMAMQPAEAEFHEGVWMFFGAAINRFHVPVRCRSGLRRCRCAKNAGVDEGFDRQLMDTRHHLQIFIDDGVAISIANATKIRLARHHVENDTVEFIYPFVHFRYRDAEVLQDLMTRHLDRKST